MDERADDDLPLQQSPLHQIDSKATNSIVLIKTRRSIRKLKERNRSENDGEQATASSSNFGIFEHAFRESPYAECQIDSNAIGCPVISNTRRSICNLTERNRSKNDEEQAQASSSNFGMVKHALRESLHAECQIDSNAIGSAVISNTRQSICNLIERNRSKNVEEQAQASSSNFGVVKHAFRESLHAECQIDSNAIGSAVISTTRRSICNLIERNRSKNDEEEAQASSSNFGMVKYALR